MSSYNYLDKTGLSEVWAKIKEYVDENSGGGDAITYTISATNNTITLTGSDSSTSTATFPIYDGTILSTWEGGNF